jgi:hypothetical protein
VKIFKNFLFADPIFTTMPVQPKDSRPRVLLIPGGNEPCRDPHFPTIIDHDFLGNPNTVGFLPLASRMDLPGEHREVSKPVAQAFSKGIPFQLPIIQ